MTAALALALVLPALLSAADLQATEPGPAPMDAAANFAYRAVATVPVTVSLDQEGYPACTSIGVAEVAVDFDTESFVVVVTAALTSCSYAQHHMGPGCRKDLDNDVHCAMTDQVNHRWVVADLDADGWFYLNAQGPSSYVIYGQLVHS